VAKAKTQFAGASEKFPGGQQQHAWRGAGGPIDRAGNKKADPEVGFAGKEGAAA
jgi:hypothetical protein